MFGSSSARRIAEKVDFADPCDAEDAYGRNALSDEATAEGYYRNGTTRARLQSDARHEHYGC